MPFVFAMVLMLLTACADRPLDLTLQVEHGSGLQPGNPIVLANQFVGSVSSVGSDTSGHDLAKLSIAVEFRDRVNEGTAFVVTRDPADATQRRIELKPGRTDAPLLADGATVWGTVERGPASAFAEMLRGLTEGLSVLGSQVERFRSELEGLPNSAEGKRFREEFSRLRDELVKAQKSTEESVKKEIIPQLQQELHMMEKKLEELKKPARAATP